MLISNRISHQSHTLDSGALKRLETQANPDLLPITMYYLYYHISSSQRLSLTFNKDTPTFYLQSMIQGQMVSSIEVSVVFPFNFKTLLQKVSHHDLPAFFQKNFTVRLHQGAYTVFPLLKGGGGALTTCAGPKLKKSQLSPDVDEDQSRKPHQDFNPQQDLNSEDVTPYQDLKPRVKPQDLKNEIGKKRKDIELAYLPERDGYPQKANLVKVGPFYEELVKNILEKTERENWEKFQLSTQNFRNYIAEEIENEEPKLLRTKFEESLKANKSLEHILLSMIKLLREDLYLKAGGKDSGKDTLFEPLFPYEEKIMIRMIISTLLRGTHSYVNEAEEFEVKVAHKILKYTKGVMKIHHDKHHEAGRILSEISKSKPRSNTNLKLALSKPYKEAIKQAELEVLRALPWAKYSAPLLVKHYNAITDSKEDIDKRNRAVIEEIVNSILNLYQEKEDTLTAGEINELVGLGGIRHHPENSQGRSLFQRLLSQFASDINNDLVFNSLKVQAMAAIIFQHTDEGEESSRIDDDLKQCLDVLHRQVERRLFTVENQNMQDCMDAFNLVLYTMATRGVKGFRGSKEVVQLATTLKDMLPGLAKTAFSLLFGNQTDPSLRIKAKYAQEALKRIGTADTDLSDLESALLDAAPAVISIVSGVFSMNPDSVMNGLKQLAMQGLQIYSQLEKGWYNEVNKVLFLANMEFEEFEKRYFNPASKVSIAGEEFVYYISRELYKIARTTSRTYADRKKSIEWLGDIYQGETIEGKKLDHFNFTGKQDIKTYLQKCISDLARMPQEDKLSFDAGLGKVALRVLNRLKLKTIRQDTNFEFIPNKTTESNALLTTAFKTSMTLEHALNVMYTNSTAYYKKELKHIDYIEIEGEKYMNRIKLNKREPLWNSSPDHALNTFLNSPEYPVLLIQGDAGTGKSTFLKVIEYQQWKSYVQGHSSYIPIFVRLSEILNPAKCLSETFQTLHFSPKVLEQLKEEGANRSYLFIFDGYDELKAPKNLYEVNKLFEYGKNAKMIVTSREEYLKGYGNYIKYFCSRTGNDLLEYRITPLTERQRDVYFSRRANLNKKICENTNDKALKTQLEGWISVDNYTDAIKKILGLEELLKTPYMLTIIANILPLLKSDVQSRITKANIYKVFTMKYFEVEMERILKNSKEELPKGLDLEKSFYEFAKDLAINMYLTDRTSVKIEGSTYTMDYTKAQPQNQKGVAQEPTKPDEAQRFERFFSDDLKVKIARSGVPITMMEGQVRFNHKSIMEYFAARCIYDELKFCTVDALHKRTLSWKLLKGGNQTNQESDVLNFLKEMIEDNDYKQTNLNELIATSIEKQDKPEKPEKQEKPLNEPQSATMTSPLTMKTPVSSSLSPLKASAKLTSPWKLSPSVKTQYSESVEKQSKILKLESSKSQNLSKSKKEESGVHVIPKLKKAVMCRDKNEVVDNFFLNIIMIMSSFWPEVIEWIDVEAMDKLEQIPNTPKDFKEALSYALSKYHSSHQNTINSKPYEPYARQYLSYKLKGNYKGETMHNYYGCYAHGQGEIKYDDGDIYIGSWIENKKQGYGVYTFANHEKFRVYDGYWQDDKFHGEGRMEFVDSSVYYGHWEQGAQEGWGEFIEYTTENEILQVVRVHKGYWSRGKKHGTGTINFERHNYHGTWDRGVVVKGQMEFANGVKVPGIYSEEDGFKPDPAAGRAQFNHEYSVKVADTLVFVRQRVSQFEGESSTPIPEEELLVQDDDGNSPLLLYFKKAKSRGLNEMMPHFLRFLISNNESVHHNKRGENLIHMIIYNKNISVGYKNNLLDKIRRSFPKLYSDHIMPDIKGLAPRMPADVPLLYAVEHLGMLNLQNNILDPVKAKLEMIKKLTPQRNANKYLSKEIKLLGTDPLTLTLLEFDGENQQGLYIGPASSIKTISDQIKRFSDNVLAALVMRGEKELLSKLIEQQFFFLHAKNLRSVVLNKIEITTEANEKKTLEQLFVDNYGDLQEAPLFKITESLISQLPASPINTTIKKNKQVILGEYSKFMVNLILDHFRLHMPLPATEQTYQYINQLQNNFPLFNTALKVGFTNTDVCKAVLSWLGTKLRTAEQDEDSLHHIVKTLMGDRLRQDYNLWLWLATPGENGLFRSPKYCFDVFVKYYSLNKPYDMTQKYNIYRWFEDYFKFAKDEGKNKRSKINPEDFKLEDLAGFVNDPDFDLLRPLISQSLVVAAIELKDAKLALKIIDKCGHWIQKLHDWETVWLRDGIFFRTPDSTKPYVNDEREDPDPDRVAIKVSDTDSAKMKVIEGLVELNEVCKDRFYKNQLYFADLDASNILLIPEKNVEDPVVEVQNGLCILEVQGETEFIKCLAHESMVKVVKMLVSRSIYITGLRENSGLILDFFFQSDYLLYDQDYVHNCLTSQDVYNDVDAFDYREAIQKHVMKQYSIYFSKKLSPLNLFTRPDITKIIQILLRTHEAVNIFFTSVINEFIIQLKPDQFVNRVSFLQELVLSLQNYLLPEDFTQLCCDVYMKIESYLNGRENVAATVDAEKTQYYRKNQAKGLKLLESQYQAFETELKAQTISTEEAETIMQTYKAKSIFLETIAQYDKQFIDANRHLQAAREAVQRIESSSITVFLASMDPNKYYRRDYKSILLEALAILFDASEPTWQSGYAIMSEIKFLSNLMNFSFDSLSLEKIEKVKHMLNDFSETKIQNEGSVAFDIFTWILEGINFARCIKVMQESELTPEKISKLKKEHTMAKTAFHGYRQREYRVKVLSKQIQNLKSTIQNLKKDYNNEVQNGYPNNEITPSKIYSLLRFFVEVVWKNLPFPTSRKIIKFVFCWVDRWLQGGEQNIKSLIETIISGKLDFEEVTSHAALIYQRLIALAITAELKDQVLDLLDKIQGRLHRIQLWTILGNDSGASEDLDDIPAKKKDKLKDQNNRDKELQDFDPDSEVILFVPAGINFDQKAFITQETQDMVMIVEEDSDAVLRILRGDKMKEVRRKLEERGVNVNEDAGPSHNPRALNGPSGKIAQTKLQSPDEWDCKNYKTYLSLLLEHPDSRTDPIGWLLKNTNVLKKVMLSVDTEQKAKDFFNNFVAKHTTDVIKSAEEILLTKVIKNIGIVFTGYLELINKHPDTKNRFSQMYKNCIVEGLDSSIAQDLLLHLLEFPESCPHLNQFVGTTLQNIQDHVQLCRYQLIKQLLNSHLSGRKTAEQTRKWTKRFSFEIVDGSEVIETLIHNLLLSIISDVPDEDKDENYNKQIIEESLRQGSSIFDAVIRCLGYELITSENGGLEIAEFKHQPLLTQRGLAVFYKDLRALIEVSTINLPNASVCKGYNEFVQKIGISLPPTLDILSYSVLSLQIITHLQLFEELIKGSMWSQHISIQFIQSSLESPPPIQYSIKDTVKSVSISYYLDSFQGRPKADLFRANTDNFCQIESALSQEIEMERVLYDPLLATLQCLHDSLFSDSTDENLRVELEQKLPHFSLFSKQNANTMELSEQLVYNCLYCVCLKTKSADESRPQEELLEIFQNTKKGAESLVDFTLAILGIKIQSKSENTITMKQTAKPLCSIDDLHDLESRLTELIISSTASLSKLVDRKAKKCIGYRYMKEKFGIDLPEDLNAANFCVLSVILAMRISTLFGNANLESGNTMEQQELTFKLTLTSDKFPHVNYLLSLSEIVVPLYYKIRKLKQIHAAYFIDIIPFSDMERKQLCISRSNAPSQASEYIAFSREFLVSYCGTEQNTTSKKDIPSLLKNMVYNHERLASSKPEQLQKIRLLEHIMKIFLTIFEKMYFIASGTLDKITLSKLKQYFIKDKDITPLSCLKMLTIALGYNLEIESSSHIMSLTRTSQPICSMKELLSVRSFLVDTYRVSKIKRPSVKMTPDYELFKSTTGLNLPENCDIFNLYIFLIDLTQSLTLTDDLNIQDPIDDNKTNTQIKCQYKLRFVLQPEGQLQPMNLEEKDNIKIVNVHYKIRSTKEWPEGQLLEINESVKESRIEKEDVGVVQKRPAFRDIVLQCWQPSEKLRKVVDFEDDDSKFSKPE